MRPTDPNASALNRRVAMLEKRLDGIDVDHLQRTAVAHERSLAALETALATLRGRVEAHLAPELQSPMRAARPIDAGTTLDGNPPSKRAAYQPHDRVVPRAELISLAERAEEKLRLDAEGGIAAVPVSLMPSALRLHANNVEAVLETPSSGDLRSLAVSLVRLALFLDAQSGE